MEMDQLEDGRKVEKWSEESRVMEFSCQLSNAIEDSFSYLPEEGYTLEEIRDFLLNRTIP